jgi:abhydrolase domain-containing protein 1/3
VFRPTPYLFNGHLQTLYYAFTHLKSENSSPQTFVRSLVPLADGGQLAVDWIGDSETKLEQHFTDNTPIVVILPGLTGHRSDGYIKVVIDAVLAKGYKCAILNHRGCSDTLLTSRNMRRHLVAKLYCAGSIDDASAGFAAIRQSHPHNPLYAIGISLGGCILGNVSEGCLNVASMWASWDPGAT